MSHFIFYERSIYEKKLYNYSYFFSTYFIFIGCNKNNPADNSQPNYIGTWEVSESSLTYTLTISADNKFIESNKAEGLEVARNEGKWEVNGNTITFTPQQCKAQLLSENLENVECEASWSASLPTSNTWTIDKGVGEFTLTKK